MEVTESGGQYLLRWEYSTGLFDAATIESVANSYRTLLREAVRGPHVPLNELPLLTAREWRHVSTELNRTDIEYEEPRCIHRAISAQARRTPRAVAIRFQDQAIDYGQLEDRSNRIARQLIERGCCPERRVGVIAERSLELPVVLLAILQTGAAFVPFDPADGAERLRWAMGDAAVDLVLNPSDFRDTDISETPAAALAETDPASAAYMIYTSGSTGNPKGVVNTHGGIFNRLAWMQAQYGLNAEDVVLQKTPLTFDVSVWELFWPLMFGAQLVMAPPGIHRDPRAICELIRRNKVTTLHFVPVMLNEFLERPEAAALPSLRRVFSSGEELRGTLAERCLAVTGARLFNLYGPTEAAVDVSWHECVAGEGDRRVPIGTPIANTQLHVLDKGLRPVPIGMTGELYIAGMGLARGYWNRSDLTAERFLPNPFGAAGSRMYRSGDLARRRGDGAIEYLGRIDGQTKIGGVRAEPGEVEAAAARHRNVAAAYAKTIRCTGSPRICCYVVWRNTEHADPGELRRFLARHLPAAMVPAWIIGIESAPLTPSGKLDRRALPDPEESAIAEFTPSSDRPMLDILLAFCGSVLGHACLPEQTFSDAGGKSLDAIRVASRFSAEFSIELDIEKLLDDRSLASVAASIADEPDREDSTPAFEKQANRPDELPLSYEQERLWILDQLTPGATGYTIGHAALIEGPLSAEIMAGAIQATISRHEALRTTFHAGKLGSPVQRIHSEGVTDIAVLPINEERIAEAARLESETPFDLTCLPLARFRIYRCGEGRHVLLALMHHIVTDGWSIGPLLRDLLAEYTALSTGRPVALPPLRCQYGDYAVWQRSWLTGDNLAGRLRYWTQYLKGVQPCAVPPDRARPALQSFRGEELRVVLPTDAIAALEKNARDTGATLFMALLSVFAVLVSRYSGQTDLAIATPTANRRHPSFEDSVGFFVNTLVLRLDLAEADVFDDVLRCVRRSVLNALQHSDAPLEKIVEALQPERDLSRPPLFQTLFAFQNAPLPPMQAGELRLENLNLDIGKSRYDLRLSIEPGPQGPEAAFQYNVDLYERSTVERVMSHFVNLLRGIAKGLRTSVWMLPLMPEEETVRWRDEFNRTQAPLSAIRLEGLFLHRAAANPAAIAVVAGGVRMTYGELEARSRAIAQAVAQYARPGELVAIVMEKGWEQVAAALGILRAGAAYLPIDHAVPPQRLRLLLEDGGVRLALTQAQVAKRLSWPANIVHLNAARLDCVDTPLPLPGSNDALAYVIYTSGSTGRPKGVTMAHRAVVNTILDVNSRFDIGPTDRVLALSSHTFDLSVWDIFGTLAAGGTIVMPSPDLLADPRHWETLIASERVTIWNSVPALMEMLVESAGAEPLPSLRLCLLSGDWIPTRLPERIRRLAPGARVISLGGATEAAIWSILFPIDGVLPEWHSIPYGLPMANQKVFVLDSHFGVCPPGVTGSIYIGGAGLAEGYWRDPQKTSASFFAHPISGERIYRTGDLGRYHPAGYIELLGREDAQLKIGGFRIEPGEVEAVLQMHPSVRQCIALARQTNGREPRLAAYAVLARQDGCNSDATPPELLSFLRERLPQYMVPKSVTLLDKLPVNANGKVDTSALPDPELTTTITGGRHMGALEELIASVFASVLNLESVDGERNFFDIGGTSLALVQGRRLLEQKLQREIAVVDLFRYPTVRELAAHLSQQPVIPRAFPEGAERARKRRGAASLRKAVVAADPPAFR